MFSRITFLCLLTISIQSWAQSSRPSLGGDGPPKAESTAELKEIMDAVRDNLSLQTEVKKIIEEAGGPRQAMNNVDVKKKIKDLIAKEKNKKTGEVNKSVSATDAKTEGTFCAYCKAQPSIEPLDVKVTALGEAIEKKIERDSPPEPKEPKEPKERKKRAKSDEDEDDERPGRGRLAQPSGGRQLGGGPSNEFSQQMQMMAMMTAMSSQQNSGLSSQSYQSAYSNVQSQISSMFPNQYGFSNNSFALPSSQINPAIYSAYNSGQYRNPYAMQSIIPSLLGGQKNYPGVAVNPYLTNTGYTGITTFGYGR